MEHVTFSKNYEIIYSNHTVNQDTPRLPLHYHDELELYFVEKGGCTYFIDEKAYDAEPGDVIIVPKGILHKVTAESDDHTYAIMYCRKKHIPYSVINHLKKIPYLYRNPAISEKLQNILKEIEKEFNNPDDFSNDELLSYVHMMFILFVRNLDTVTHVESNNIHIKEILQYIQKNFSQNITLESLSQQFSLSTEHISRIFKKETGFNFIEYLTTIRMHEAEQLLLSGEKKSISEIAYLCGFNDSNYFSERFKQINKVSPSQFRKK